MNTFGKAGRAQWILVAYVCAYICTYMYKHTSIPLVRPDVLSVTGSSGSSSSPMASSDIDLTNISARL